MACLANEMLLFIHVISIVSELVEVGLFFCVSLLGHIASGIRFCVLFITMEGESVSSSGSEYMADCSEEENSGDSEYESDFFRMIVAMIHGVCHMNQ